MTVRRLAAADLPALDWLDDGSRSGLAVAVDAGPARALVLAGPGGSDSPLAVLAVDLPPWRGRDVPWLWLVEVHPGHRGRGIGGTLLEEAHRVLADGGHAAVELSVDDGNLRAAALYRRLGYVGVGAGAHRGPTGPEAWTLMRLELTTAQMRTKR